MLINLKLLTMPNSFLLNISEHGENFCRENFMLSFPLIQEGQLSVSGERMCTILVNRLED